VGLAGAGEKYFGQGQGRYIGQRYFGQGLCKMQIFWTRSMQNADILDNNKADILYKAVADILDKD
jgi:hypothetical protein